MFDSFFEQALELNRGGQSFALAVVVRHEKPSSGKTGDKAIIRADGTIEGWVGGGCAQPVVIREAKKALEDGKPRFVRIAPTSGSSAEGVIEYPMTCHSGGTIDVYIEPILPKPHLVIFGASWVARALARLGAAIEYRITVIAPEAEPDRFALAEQVLDKISLDAVDLNDATYLIVATQGEHDEDALEVAARSSSNYVAFVASRKKAAAVFEALRLRGVPEDALRRVRNPAGLDLNAKLPEEIAVSILAEVVQEIRGILETLPQVDPASLSDGSNGEVGTNGTVETLQIGSMSCAHCMHTVETALNELEGVTVHAVEIGSATISYDQEDIPRDRILAALEERGYPVLPDN